MRYRNRADNMFHYFGDLIRSKRYTKKQLQNWWQNHKGDDFTKKLEENMDKMAELIDKMDELIDEWSK